MDQQAFTRMTSEQRVTLMYYHYMVLCALFECSDAEENQQVTRMLPDGWKDCFEEWYQAMDLYYENME